MNGVFERQDKGDHYERTMNITCNDWEAQMLLDLANQSYPNIAPDIASNISRAKRACASLNRQKLRRPNAEIVCA